MTKKRAAPLPAPETAPAFATPALRDAVAQVYATFRGGEALAGPLDVCTYCCCPAEVERELREWPRRRLTARHFYQYNDSAKSEVQPVPELRHLLPRLLELVALGEEIHHSTELFLDRLGRCPEGTWSTKERQVLDAFAAAYFEGVLREDALRRFDGPLDILLMFDIGGFDVAPLLDAWLACEDPRATALFVEATYFHFWECTDYVNAFATNRPAFRAQLRAWILEPANRLRFAEKLLASDFEALATQRQAVGRMSFATMVDAVYDQLA